MLRFRLDGVHESLMFLLLLFVLLFEGHHQVLMLLALNLMFLFQGVGLLLLGVRLFLDGGH